MEPWTELARARGPGGENLVLRRRGGMFEIRCDGWDLMSNRAHHSEQMLGRLACAGLPGTERGGAPHVLIGGLGMGYTLRAALDALPAGARVTVAEIFAEVVDWNRGPLAPSPAGRSTIRASRCAAPTWPRCWTRRAGVRRDPARCR